MDLSRGVIRLELTKSGKRREVPMRQVVDNTLTSFSNPPQGRVFKTRSIRTMMREGSLQELKEILGHADITMTLRYAYLSPAHLRGAMIRTERQAVPTASTQRSAQEAPALAEGSFE